MYGSGVLVDDQETTVQIAFGMDNNYKCELEVWGNKGCLTTGRVLTAPVEFEPQIIIKENNIETIRTLSPDDAFKKSIEYFLKCIDNKEMRFKSYEDILKQAKLIREFMEKTNVD